MAKIFFSEQNHLVYNLKSSHDLRKGVAVWKIINPSFFEESERLNFEVFKSSQLEQRFSCLGKTKIIYLIN
jgi:hypothetical protein